MTHTPTPWEIGSHDDNGGMPYINIKGSDGWHIAKTSTRDEYDANAAHIVKCVNLHDELVCSIKELLKVYNEPDMEICCSGYQCGCYGASVRQQVEHYAREVLKKARGE